MFVKDVMVKNQVGFCMYVNNFKRQMFRQDIV